jgi:hypothetical protein
LCVMLELFGCALNNNSNLCDRNELISKWEI